MAALQKIRNKAGLLIGVLGFALAAFVLGDLFSNGSTYLNKFRDKAFVVDGDVVSTGDYQERITEWENFQKMLTGKTSLDEASLQQIREATYQQMVREMMLDKEAEKLGLAVSKEEINDMVYGEVPSPMLAQLPFFMDEKGQFSRQAVTDFFALITKKNPSAEEQNIIAAYKPMWLFVERMMKYQRLQEKYNSLLGGAILVNSLETKQQFDDSKYTADLAYVLQPYSSIADSAVAVSNDELKKLYDARKKNFVNNTQLAKVTYFVKNVLPSEEDVKEAEKMASDALQKLNSDVSVASVVSQYSEVPYADAFFSISSLASDATLKEFATAAAVGQVSDIEKSANSFRIFKLVDKTVAPDSVKIQVIALPEVAGKASKADSVLNVIKGGKAFDAVAKELGQPSEAQWITEPMLAGVGQDFQKAAFATAAGEVAKVTVNNQTLLVKVDERTAPVSKVKVALVQVPVVAGDKTQNALDTELNKFVSEYGTAEKFVKGAEEKGYNVIPSAMIAASDQMIGQLTDTRQVVSWAFNNDKGSVKKFDFSDKRVVARIDEQIEPGYMPFEEVSSLLKAELLRDKKAEKIMATLKSKNLKSLEEYASNMNARVDSVKFVNFATNAIANVGQEPALNVYAELGKVNEVSAPVKGKTGVFAIKVLNRTELKDKKYDAKEVAQGIQQSNFYRVYQAMEVLQTKLKVEDNRVKFF